MRLIDADALDDVVMRLTAEGDRGITRSEYKLIDSVLFEFPTIDAVPVVRCKDCVHFETGDWCVLTGARAREDGYCAWGERNVEEED